MDTLKRPWLEKPTTMNSGPLGEVWEGPWRAPWVEKKSGKQWLGDTEENGAASTCPRTRTQFMWATPRSRKRRERGSGAMSNSKEQIRISSGRENWIRREVVMEETEEMRTDQMLNDFNSAFTSSICEGKRRLRSEYKE